MEGGRGLSSFQLLSARQWVGWWRGGRKEGTDVGGGIESVWRVLPEGGGRRWEEEEEESC